LLGKGATICKPVSKQEKRILLEGSFFPIILISLISIAFILSLIYNEDHPEYTLIYYLPIALIAFFIRRRLKKRHRQMKEEIINIPKQHGEV
jgi:hypothetical protein